MKTQPYRLDTDVVLAEHTTLGVGGPARALVTCADREALAAALGDASEAGVGCFVLGEGSNVLVADGGYDGWVIRYRADAYRVLARSGNRTRLVAEAGMSWDTLVARTVAEGLGGIEALSGIPGLVGAAPVQNIGAYGQQLDETLVAVHGLDRLDGRHTRIPAEDCALDYRTSRFKTEWRDRYVITAIELELERTAVGSVRYRDLERRFEGQPPPTPAAVRGAVLAVRAAKSMVLDAADGRPPDPNRRSAGSFFTNPVVDAESAAEIARRADRGESMPRWRQTGGRVKLSAAWLIEAAGFRRGDRFGDAALSSRHVLALINPGHARARDLIAFAAEIRHQVKRRFGIALEPEPVWLGFKHRPSTLLDNPRLLEAPS